MWHTGTQFKVKPACVALEKDTCLLIIVQVMSLCATINYSRVCHSTLKPNVGHEKGVREEWCTDLESFLSRNRPNIQYKIPTATPPLYLLYEISLNWVYGPCVQQVLTNFLVMIKSERIRGWKIKTESTHSVVLFLCYSTWGDSLSVGAGCGGFGELTSLMPHRRC